MSELSIPSSQSKGSSSVRPDAGVTVPGVQEDDLNTVLYSFISCLEKNETNLRILKQKLKNIVDILLPIETYSSIVNDMEKAVKLLEQEEENIVAVTQSTIDSITEATEKYELLKKEGEQELARIRDLEIQDSHNKQKIEFCNNIKLGIITDEESKLHYKKIRNLENEQMKQKTKALGQVKLSQRNLEYLKTQLASLSSKEGLKQEISKFMSTLENLREYEEKMREIVDTVENPREVDLEELNSNVQNLINIYKRFQVLNSQVGNLKSEFETKQELIKLNEQMSLLVIELESEEAGKAYLQGQLDELNKELNQRLKQHTESTSQDHYMSIGEEVKVFNSADVEKMKEEVNDSEKIPFVQQEDEEKVEEKKVERVKVKRKSQKTMKIETQVNKLKSQIDRIKQELSKKRGIQEQIDQIIANQNRVENQNKQKYNAINFQLAKTCEKYQILVHHMNKPKNVFSPEFISPLIGVLCKSLNVTKKSSIFACFKSDPEGIMTEISLYEIYDQLLAMVAKKVKFKKCRFWISSFERVHTSSVLELKELIEWIFESDLLGCLKANANKHLVETLNSQDIYYEFVSVLKKIVGLISLQSQLQVKIGYESNMQRLKELTSQASFTARELNYKSIAKKIDRPKLKKKVKYSTY